MIALLLFTAIAILLGWGAWGEYRDDRKRRHLEICKRNEQLEIELGIVEPVDICGLPPPGRQPPIIPDERYDNLIKYSRPHMMKQLSLEIYATIHPVEIIETVTRKEPIGETYTEDPINRQRFNGNAMQFRQMAHGQEELSS